MGVEVQLKITEQNGYNPGDIICILEGPPYQLGIKKSSLPHFVNIQVTDAKLSDIQEFEAMWMEDYDVLETDENTKYQIKPKYAEKENTPSISLKQAAGINKVLTSQLKVPSIGVVTKTSDISFPKATIKKVDIEREINDSIKKRYKNRRYNFSSTVVTDMVKKGTCVKQMTLADFKVLMFDKMGE